MIYDYCMFLNENDLFEVRLNAHWNVVDKFIVCEAGQTHTGLKKSFNFDVDRFKEYEDKIVYIRINDFEEEMKKFPNFFNAKVLEEVVQSHQNIDDWKREAFQVNYVCIILDYLKASDNDLVLGHCVDEILKEKSIEEATQFCGKDEIIRFNTDLYVYKLNLLHKTNVTAAGCMTTFKKLKELSPAVIRQMNLGDKYIEDAGWHYTFLDGTDGENVLLKQKSWAHSKDVYANKKTKFDFDTKEEALERLYLDYEPTLVESAYLSYPTFVQNNLDKFKNYIYKEEAKA